MDWKNQKFRKEVYYKINKEWTKLGWKQVKYDISDWIVSKMESTEMYTGMYVEMQKNLGLVTIDYDSALAFCDQAILDRKELRLKKKGFPVYKKEDHYGDMIVTFQVKLPTNLSAKEKELFTELSKISKT